MSDDQLDGFMVVVAYTDEDILLAWLTYTLV